MTNQNSQKRILRGEVISDKMQKTVVVQIRRLKKHPKYKKFFKVNKKFKAHSPENQYRIGDKVLIQEVNPISKDKRWLVVGKVAGGVDKKS